MDGGMFLSRYIEGDYPSTYFYSNRTFLYETFLFNFRLNYENSEIKIHFNNQYLRQNRSTCKGFCRFIELLSATTTTPHLQEALDGYFSTFAMSPTHCNEDHAASMQPYCAGSAGDDRACDDVGPVPVGWHR